MTSPWLPTLYILQLTVLQQMVWTGIYLFTEHRKQNKKLIHAGLSAPILRYQWHFQSCTLWHYWWDERRERRLNMVVQAPNPRSSFPINMVHLLELFLDASDASSPTAEINFTLFLSSFTTSSKLTPQNQGTYEYSLTFSCNDCRWTACITSESTFLVQTFLLSVKDLAFLSHCCLLQKEIKIKNRYHTTHRDMPGSELQLPQCGLQPTILQVP